MYSRVRSASFRAFIRGCSLKALYHAAGRRRLHLTAVPSQPIFAPPHNRKCLTCIILIVQLKHF